MPKVQYKDVVNNITLTKDMPTPKKITQLTAWYKGARKVIPEIPEINLGLWYIEQQEATLDWVRFDLKHKDGQRVYLVIFRNLGSMQKGT